MIKINRINLAASITQHTKLIELIICDSKWQVCQYYMHFKPSDRIKNSFKKTLSSLSAISSRSIARLLFHSFALYFYLFSRF